MQAHTHSKGQRLDSNPGLLTTHPNSSPLHRRAKREHLQTKQGQLTESNAKKKGKGRGPGGADSPQAARSGNKTFPTFSVRPLEFRSQGCRGLSTPRAS